MFEASEAGGVWAYLGQWWGVGGDQTQVIRPLFSQGMWRSAGVFFLNLERE